MATERHRFCDIEPRQAYAIRDCPIKMRLVPYGAGWTDVYLDIGKDSLYFIITNQMGDQFDDFMSILYHLYPPNNDPENLYHRMDYKCGICEQDENGDSHVVRIVDDLSEAEPFTAFRDIPWKAEFEWDEEGASSRWQLTRAATEDADFMLNLKIDIDRDEVTSYEYLVRYKDLCYAVAKACTETLKEYGIYGYHYSTYTQDMNLRYLLFIKAIALDNGEIRELTSYEEKGHGETSNLEKELALLLQDM